LSLLHLQVVDHSPYTINLGGIVSRSAALAFTRDVAAKRDHAIGGLHSDFAALDSRIAIESALHFAGNLSVGAGRPFGAPSENTKH